MKECINDDAQSRDFYCEVIMDEADKMNQMVKKLLTLNQLESGNETITMERFDVTELIRGVLHSVDILIGQSGITVTECPAEPIYVWADEFKGNIATKKIFCCIMTVFLFPVQTRIPRHPHG